MPLSLGLPLTGTPFARSWLCAAGIKLHPGTKGKATENAAVVVGGTLGIAAMRSMKRRRDERKGEMMTEEGK